MRQKNSFKKQRPPELQAINNVNPGISLVVQWLRLHASNAGDVGSITGQRIKISHAM